MRPEEIEKMFRLEDTYWWFVARRRLVALLLNRYAARRQGQRVLDVGCGTGGTLATLAPYGEVWAADLSIEALGCCRRRSFGRLVQTDAERLSLAGESFDIITCLDVLEHVDDVAALAELHRVCRPGGLLLITVPAYPFLWSEHDEALAHKRRYYAGDLRRKLVAAGFEVVRMTHIITALFLPVLVLRLLQRLRPRGRAAPQTAHIILPGPLNTLLIWLCQLEARLSLVFSLPFGVSVVAVARRPEGEGRKPDSSLRSE